ncbi:adenylate/guanylate cyclase domain-containing protein [Megalodesulfovibrio paquesii]
MSISTYVALQSSVGSLLSLMGRSLRKVPVTLQNSINYLYEDPEFGLTAVDIRSRVPTAMFNIMAEKLKAVPLPLRRFIMLTPYHPNPYEDALFHQHYRSIAPVLSWQTVEQFARDLGVTESDAVAIASAAAAEKLKTADLVDHLSPEEVASHTVSHAARAAQSARVSRILRDEEQSVLEANAARLAIVRKMPGPVASAFARSGKSQEEFFRFGQSLDKAVIVFTDIKNFSHLVKLADMELLNEHLYRYYKRAKELLREHGGVLDKFIGDSVLAVFNYPQPEEEAFERAIRFGVEMVALGDVIFGGLAERMNQVIRTGTRVGIDTGRIWVLNIGEDELELSFVGDAINLASRLEKQCEVDGVLFSQIVAWELSQRNETFFTSLQARSRTLEREEVKGQQVPVKGWQIPPEQVRVLAHRWAVS